MVCGEGVDAYGVLWYCVGNRGCREWLAGPPAIDRSSLRDGGVWGDKRRDAASTLGFVGRILLGVVTGGVARGLAQPPARGRHPCGMRGLCDAVVRVEGMFGEAALVVTGRMPVALFGG
jgi:hypothetical protein